MLTFLYTYERSTQFMIRLFASDMDGTLLNNKGYISDKTIKAVKRLQKSGVTFLINTGRDYHAAKRELDEASISCDMICHSGACTYDIYGNVLCLLFMKPLSIG